jgi:hypothetical protein
MSLISAFVKRGFKLICTPDYAFSKKHFKGCMCMNTLFFLGSVFMIIVFKLLFGPLGLYVIHLHYDGWPPDTFSVVLWLVFNPRTYQYILFHFTLKT